ncbi:MAG: domain S-box protein [Mucilaginibacter sp.]|nr:domain S-box protein [Mucilaginibacter sp.]
MTQTLRPTGIDVIGDIPWGTHFCHFYETKQDLISVLVPYFKAGLENNEYCIWITSGHTTVEEALTALKGSVPNLDQYFERGSIEILSHRDWYLRAGHFELGNAIQSILDRLRIALQQNFEGLRLNGDEAWVDRRKWHDFIEYEGALTPAILGKRLIISCDYQLAKHDAADLLDIAALHECAVAKRKGEWEVLEVPQLKKTKAQLNLEKKLLEQRVADKTEELLLINEEVKIERTKRENTVLSLNRSQSNLKTIFDTADIAFILLDSNLHILLFNAIASYWSELSFGALLKEGAYFPGLFNEERKQSLVNMMNEVLSGQSLNYETNYYMQDGSTEWFRVSIDPVRDIKDQVIGLCYSATNITQGKLIESAHNRVNGQLAQRNKDLEKFAYIVSHNLRSPLANMIGLAKMLKQDSMPASERGELEAFLFQSIENLDDVVHDLNRILQLDTDHSLKKEKVILPELVNEVETRFQALTKHDSIKIITDFTKANEIFSVKSNLHSIFYNLIANSIIYRQLGRPPVIEIRSESQQGKLIIYFKDYGKDNYLKKGKTKDKSYEKIGLNTQTNGIGLHTVKSKVEALGGSIGVSALPKNGTEFRIELPLQ